MSGFRYFTREEWAALSDEQREVIRLQRMAAVAAYGVEHMRRYHVTAVPTTDDAA